MVGSTLVLTAIRPEAAALRRVGVSATPVGIRSSRLSTISIPAGTQQVILAGVGGGLDPALAIGDVIIEGPVDPLPTGARRGVIHTVDRLVSTAADKAALFLSTGAAVVDMEQSIVHDWAARHGLQLIGIRAVSDTATDAVDPSVLGLVDEVGRVKPLAVAATLLRRPMMSGQLRKLGVDTRTALDALAVAVRAVAIGR